ncbi:aspartate aminotransferase [Histoplasma ohiense]|nr:aspartate aminotransferase [Histoplasma ohiense (nom. inval.)]
MPTAPKRSVMSPPPAPPPKTSICSLTTHHPLPRTTMKMVSLSTKLLSRAMDYGPQYGSEQLCTRIANL